VQRTPSLVIGSDAGDRAFVHPLVFLAPADVALGPGDVGAATAEAIYRAAAHRFDRKIARQDEQVGHDIA
jgi:hypothetical protein